MSTGRAILTGAITGFLRSNNERRERMEQRLYTMANDRATREREQAKTEYSDMLKASQAEEAEYNSLRSVGDIDENGNYSDQYYTKLAYAEFKDPNVREAYGNDFEKFNQEFRKMAPKSYKRNYKSPAKIKEELTKLYASIDARQQESTSGPVLTGFERMLGQGIDAGIDLIGDGLSKATGGRVSMQGAVAPDSEMNTTGDLQLRTNTDLASVDPMAEQTSITPQASTETPDFQRSEAPVPIENTWKSTDADGKEYIISIDANKKVTVTPTGLTKPENGGEISMSLSDLKTAVDPQTTANIRDGQIAMRRIGNIMRDTSVATTAKTPQLVNSIIQGVKEEYIGTLGSDADVTQETNKALIAAFKDELDGINSKLPEDQQITPDERQEYLATLGGLRQDKRALAYALVRLNRASGRFNGQELQEQLDLLQGGSTASMMAALKKAEEQVTQLLHRDMQDAAASVITTQLYAEGNRRVTKNQVMGWVQGEPTYDPKNNAYYIDFHTGPYEFAYMTENGGVSLIPRESN